MTQSSPPLPLAADFHAALQKLEILWNLVPRSARPLHKNLRDDLGNVLDRCVWHAEARASSAAITSAGEESESEDSDESPLAIVMHMMRSLSPEQFLQVKILMMMRDLSDEGRFEMFEEIGGSHHLACGGEVFPDEVHECDPEGGESGPAGSLDGSGDDEAEDESYEDGTREGSSAP